MNKSESLEYMQFYCWKWRQYFERHFSSTEVACKTRTLDSL